MMHTIRSTVAGANRAVPRIAMCAALPLVVLAAAVYSADEAGTGQEAADRIVQGDPTGKDPSGDASEPVPAPATPSPAADPSAAAAAERHFATRVLPLLSQKCFACHSPDAKELQGGLNLATLADMLKGGDSEEPVIAPSQPDESPLVLAVRRLPDSWSPMPPKDNDALTPEQVAILEQWVTDGAPWPSDERLAELKKPAAGESGNTWSVEGGIAVRTSGGLSDEWTYRGYKPEDLWAYMPVKHPDVPAQKSLARDRTSAAPVNPIDAFINARLRELELPPAPAADRRTLIRRASFDLLGLPPTPEEIAAFEADPAPDAEAFARLVDRLLESPHYGENWARHWLDVVRYADSAGYANDFERGNAWRYRDYVIRAFNADKPYDRFLTEQLAGDEIHPQDPEMLIATGMLRMGPWELTAMEVPKVARQRFLDDVTDTVGQVFLAHPLQCARCHDHKFDPIPTRDYYAVQAIFATTQMAERHAAFLPAENTDGFEERVYLEQRKAYYLQVLAELNQKSIDAARKWYVEKGLDPAEFEKALKQVAAGAASQPAKSRRGAAGQPATGRSVRDSSSDAENVEEGAGEDEELPGVSYNVVRTRMLKRGIPEDRIPPRQAGFTPQDFGTERAARKGLERLAWVFDRYEPYALAVYSGRTPELKAVTAPLRMPTDPLMKGELEQSHILIGGDPFSLGPGVTPGVLSAANTLAGGDLERLAIPSEIRGRRRALAEWLVHPDNPLTARVMANRIWQWHFGQGLAGNPNNFGATGKRPTHPELLDWLAVEFRQRGWSVKAMHRLLMNSEAYRRGGDHPDRKLLAERDPQGESYAVFRPRRLTAEELRDAILAASGELNPAIGGIPARPEIPLDVALQPRQVMGTFAESWQPSPTPEGRHRRSIYTLRIRGLRDPFMEVFNAPTPENSCEARDSSTVTPQVFTLFNSGASLDRALALAKRVLEEQPANDRAAIDRVFRLALGRAASEEELVWSLKHWEQMTARHAKLEFQLPEYPREVEREAVEENTGEKFLLREPLEVYADFQPDFKPAYADPLLRGLAEVCLVLLNTNEFAFVY